MTEDSEESESESEEDENPLKKKFSATAKVALALGSSSIHSGEEDDLMSPREEAPKKFSKVGSFQKKSLIQIRNPSIYNIICWVAWTMGQANRRPSV